MQGEELKAIRIELGLSQGAFAELLGMTRETVGMMERSAAPIEKRTELAARQIYNEKSRLYGHHYAVDRAGDVELIDAQIIWDRDRRCTPAVKVVGVAGDDDLDYPSSYGACNSDWALSDDIGRLLRLFSRFIELTVVEGFGPGEVHAAFSVIPQYRYAMARGMFKGGVTD